MTTITKEWLQQTIAEFENTRDDIPFGLSDDDAKVLIVLKRALVSLDAEPVRYLNKFSGTCVTLEQQSNAADDVAVYMPLYAAPPVPVQVDIEMLASALKNAPLAPSDNQGRPRAPVVPPAIEPDYKVIKSLLPTANPDEYACCIAADMWDACRAAMLQGDEQPQNARQNIPDGNSPVSPDGWISCSERMPAQDDWVLIYSKYGEYLAGQVQGKYVELNDGTLSWLGAALHWMPLPAAPEPDQS
ncbi:hypothetical protein CB433_00275 [Salmonella enterica subsp. enterica serovar Newport]|nr:hypothetical protein [Salmonella enterica subsp. enterica serovar Newport]